MNKIFNCSFVAASIGAVLFISSCKKDESPNAQGQIELSFQINQSSAKGASDAGPFTLKDAAIAEPVYVVVTITENNGTIVSDNVVMKLIKFNDDYVTQALTLKPGNYILTKYLVLDASENVIYATPLAGSPKASWVKYPLPISFKIAKNEVTKLIPEVISIVHSNPEDFGYSTFRLNIINSLDFLIAVFTFQDTSKSYELATAHVVVTAGGNTLTTKNIGAITDTISVPDGIDNYIITVTKTGYTTYVDTIPNAELKKYFSSSDYGPLKVYLLNGTANVCAGVSSFNYGGQTYHTVAIGNQCWMKENLNIGTSINIINNSANNGIIEKYCYNNDAVNCTIYGGLYSYNEAMQYDTIEKVKGICADGWHIPDELEFETLTANYANEHAAYYALIDGGTSGFNALLGGIGASGTHGAFFYQGSYGLYISSTIMDADDAVDLTVDLNNANPESVLVSGVTPARRTLHSVRCIKNN